MLDSKRPWTYSFRMPRSRQPDPDAVRFGAILRRERIARGWTIVKLARRSGMHHQYLGVVEAGGNICTYRGHGGQVAGDMVDTFTDC